MQIRSREFWWLASQSKPFVRLHLGSYLCIVMSSVSGVARSTDCEAADRRSDSKRADELVASRRYRFFLDVR